MQQGKHLYSPEFTIIRRLSAVIILTFLTYLNVGCQVVKPELASTSVETPAAFKTSSPGGESIRPKWWTLFNDTQLNNLVGKIEGENLQLRAGLARVDRAYATLGMTRAELVPGVNGDFSINRSRRSEGDANSTLFNVYQTQYRAGLALGWEIDLWGRVKYLVDAARADAAAEEEALRGLRLSLQTQLARNYFALRFLDEERRVLEEAVQSREDNLKIASDRFEGGRTGELDVARAETELANARADLAALSGARARLENTIAVLVGQPASNFNISRRSGGHRLPQIKAGLPIDVLRNRPDVAAAVVRLDGANARIGVAKADFFPKVSLVGTGGLSSIDSNDFLTWSSRHFGIGPEVSIPVYQGGRLRSNLAGRRAEQSEALADYQNTVLESFRDVEDALADLSAYRAERTAHQQALAASRKALSLSRSRYTEGLVSSIEVIDSIREQLTAERRAVQIRGLEYEATIRLIQAVGGGLSREYCK